MAGTRLRGWSKYEPLKFARPVMSDEVGTACLRVGSRDCPSGTWQRPGYLKRVILAPNGLPGVIDRNNSAACIDI